MKIKKGFTLIEILIVIAIIGILSIITLVSTKRAITRARFSRGAAEIRALAIAVELYAADNEDYPPDVNRGLPNGLEQYITSNPSWPDSPFPNGEYDWDNWNPNSLAYNPKEQVYQISIRFCPLNEPQNCSFPNEPWAENFDYYSSVYYCIEGPCRAHSSKPMDHPSCCIGGSCPATAVKCTP